MTTTRSLIKSRKPFSINALLAARLLEPLESRQFLSITTPVPLTNESTIFSDPEGPAYGQDIIALPDGSSVVTWLSSDGDGLGIFAARVDSSGKQIGQTIPVNTYTQGYQLNPSIAPRSGGGFVIAWDGQTASKEFGVQAQIFDSQGNKIGPAITAASGSTAQNQYPDVFLLPDSGDFILTWASTGNDGHNGVHARRYDPNGGLVIDATFNVNQDGLASDIDTIRPMGSALNDGSYAIAWRSVDNTLLAQRFDEFSDFSGSNVTLVNSQSFVSFPSALTALPAGGLAVAWAGAQTPQDEYDIYVQRFNNSLSPAGIPTLVNTFTDNHQSTPSIAAMPDSGFVVAWNSFNQDGDTWGAYGQSFDANAIPRGSEFQINQETEGVQGNPRIASYANGHFAVAFSSQPIFAGDTTVRYFEGFHVNQAPTVKAFLGNPFNVGTFAAQPGHFDLEGVFVFNPGPGETDQSLLRYEVLTTDFFRYLDQPTISADGTLSFTTAQNAIGLTTFTVRAYDTGGTDFGGVDFVEFQFSLNILRANLKPSLAGPTSIQIIEDHPLTVFDQAFTFDPGAPEESDQTAQYFLTGNSNPALFNSPPSVDPDGNLTIDLAPDAVGSTALTFVVQDSGELVNGGINTSDPFSFVLTINPVNDKPTFQAQNPSPIRVNADLQVISNWATFSPGPANESDQTATFKVSDISDPSFFTKLPEVTSDGTLVYQVAPGKSGTVSFSVQAIDSGPTPAQSFVNENASDIQTFTILVTDANVRPVITGFTHEVTVVEDSEPFFAKYEFDPGSPSESDQTGTFFISTDNLSLFLTPPTIDQDGFLHFTPAPNANGTAIISLYVQDSGGTADGGIDTSLPLHVTINILPVNDAPSFSASNPPAINEDSGLQTIVNWATFNPGASNESDQTAKYISGVPYANYSDFFTQIPVIHPDGTLTYQIAPNVSGTFTFYARVQDSGPTGPGDVNESENQPFTITVNPVNDAPSFKAGPIPAVDENAGPITLSKWATGSPGPADESDQGLTYTVSSSNPSLFAIQPAIGPNGTLTYTPSPNASGTATLSVFLTDTGGTSNAGKDTSAIQTFTLTVNHVPHPIVNVASTLPNLGNGVADDALTPLFANGTNFGLIYQKPGSIIRSFTVNNAGDQDLKISNFSLPAGFTLAEPLSTTIAPGKSDTFTIYLDTNVPGVFAGEVQFNTNASNASLFNFALAGTVQAGEFHTFTSKTAAKNRTFIDDHNNKVVFNLIGAGTGTLFRTTTGQFLSLDVANSTSLSSLNITVAKNTPAGTGVTAISDIHIGPAGLNSLTGAKVNLTHSLIADANIKSLTLGDVGGAMQSNITIAGAGSDKTSVTLGAIHDLSLRTLTTISSFKALDWKDTNDWTDSFEASSLGALTISGRTQVKTGSVISISRLQGDLQADLSLTYVVPIGTAPNSPAAKPTVSSISIAGSVLGDWAFKAHKVLNVTVKSGAMGDWSTSSSAGAINITGTADHLNLDANVGITSFKAGHAVSTNLTTKGLIGAITVGDYLSGSITATKVASITTTGLNGTAKIAGDFSADMLISGVNASPNVPSLGPVNIKGSVTGDSSYKGQTAAGDWIIAGGASTIKIGNKATSFFLDVRTKDTNKGDLSSLSIAGASDHVRVDVHGKSGAISIAGGVSVEVNIGQGAFTGDLASFTSTKPLTGGFLNVDGAIGSITTGDFGNGHIMANKVGSITARKVIGTKVTTAVAADWNGVDLTLSGALLRPGQLTLGTVSIGGAVTDSNWSIARNTGSISVGAFLFSALFVGIDAEPSIITAPTKAQFIAIDGKTSTLGRFTVTGRGVTVAAPSFNNSRIAAGNLPFVQLSLVKSDSPAAYGITAATKIGTYTRVSKVPNLHTIQVTNKTAPGIYDTFGNYTLSIVG